MERLPIEIVEKIFSNLDVSDLLNCASVNTSWRNAANANFLWRSLCDRRFEVDINSRPMIEAECRVEPRFEIPTNKSERLTDVCPWRIRYAQEVHILENFKKGRYEKKHFHEIVPDKVTRFNFTIIGDTIVSVSNKFEIWSFKNGLTAETTIKPCLPFPIDKFLVMKNGFSYIQKNIITHYLLKNSKFLLKLQTAIERPLINNNIPNIVNDIETYSTKLPPFDSNYKINFNDRYVIASRVSCHNFITFIVWDVKMLQSSVFQVPFEKVPERLYMGFSEELPYRFILSFFYSFSRNIPSDTIFTFDLRNPRKFEKIVVEPMIISMNIHPIGDFVAIGYDDNLTYARGAKTVSIKCDISGALFEKRIIKTNSYICALVRHSDDINMELILTDHEFNVVRRIDILRSVGSYLLYSLYPIGKDLVTVECLYCGPNEQGLLIDLERQRSTDLKVNILASASLRSRSVNNKSFLIDTVTRQIFYFW